MAYKHNSFYNFIHLTKLYIFRGVNEVMLCRAALYYVDVTLIEH